MTALATKLNRRADIDPTGGVSEAWKSIAQANKVFGPEGWSRDVLEMRCAASRERGGLQTTAYVAKVRVTLQGTELPVWREAHGCGEGIGETPFEAHERGLKAAELDATARALATLGKAFGLEAFLLVKSTKAKPRKVAAEKAPAQERRTAAPSTAMAIPKPVRQRSPAHLAYVRKQPCLVCGRGPVDAHHLRFAQPKAMARKVSDEFTVPLCRKHHDLLHRAPDEMGWWQAQGIDPLPVAEALWQESAGMTDA